MNNDRFGERRDGVALDDLGWPDLDDDFDDLPTLVPSPRRYQSSRLLRLRLLLLHRHRIKNARRGARVSRRRLHRGHRRRRRRHRGMGGRSRSSRSRRLRRLRSSRRRRRRSSSATPSSKTTTPSSKTTTTTTTTSRSSDRAPIASSLRSPFAFATPTTVFVPRAVRPRLQCLFTFPPSRTRRHPASSLSRARPSPSPTSDVDPPTTATTTRNFSAPSSPARSPSSSSRRRRTRANHRADFDWSLVVRSSARDDDDRGARATTTTRATMSRPDRWTDGIDDAFEAYGVDGRAAATLDVRASSDRWVRFERTFRDRRWIATTRAGWTEAEENEDDAFGARMTIVFAKVDGEFARRVSRSFVEARARVRVAARRGRRASDADGVNAINGDRRARGGEIARAVGRREMVRGDARESGRREVVRDGDARWGAGVDRWIDGVVENRAAGRRARRFRWIRRGSRRSGWNRFVAIRWTRESRTRGVFSSAETRAGRVRRVVRRAL